MQWPALKIRYTPAYRSLASKLQGSPVTNPTQCIWCKSSSNPPSKEHIIPEALGCPPELVFSKGEVCERCNNSLGHIDKAVADEFDMILYLHGVHGKKGKPSEIRSRGNVVATPGYMTFNMNRNSIVAHDGTVAGGFGKSKRNIPAKLERSGDEATVSFSMDVGRGKKFRRGIYKIGFSLAAYYLGSEAVKGVEFDSIREFVVSGIGNRGIMLKDSWDGNYCHTACPPWQKEGNLAIEFRLGVMAILVDLSPDESLAPTFRSKALEILGSKGWTYIPWDK